ncbi:MAG: uncharacterized protein V7607_2096 [Solirubrobacteraceae bacterium]
MTTPAAAPTEPEVVHDAEIPCADGVLLRGDLRLPRGLGPRPAIVSLTPYHKDGLGGIAAEAAQSAFAAAGYPAALVDIRGTGASDGRPRAPFHPADADDGVALVSWASTQPWCDGTVGLWGGSYGAYAALAIAARRPEALRAIVPIMGFADPERELVHPGGHPGWLGAFGIWGLSTLTHHITPPPRALDDPEALARWRRRANRTDPYIIDLLRQAPGSRAWRRRAVNVEQIAVPAFCVAGWHDLHADAMLRCYERLTAPKQLLIGPWAHLSPNEAPIEPVDLLAAMVAWWDRWLLWRAARRDGEPRATVYVDGIGWRRFESWPPDTETRTLNATGRRALAQRASGPSRVAAVPLDATTGARSGPAGLPTPGDARDVDQRADDARSASFTTRPLEAPLDLCGRPRATIMLESVDGGGGPLVIKLADVAPDGSSRLLATGIAAAAAASLVVELGAVAHRVATGHRLRLAVARADFPRLRPTPSAAQAPVSLLTGAGRTRLDLPLVADPGEPDDPPRPALAPPPGRRLVRRADPLFILVEDGGTARVTVGEHILATLPTDTGDVDMNGFVTAATDGDDATLHGKASTRLRSAGHELVVSTTLSSTLDESTVRGETRLDGAVIAARTWTVPLPR